MKSIVTPALALSTLIVLTGFAPPAQAQTSSQAPPVSSETIQQTRENQTRKSKVILSRSLDENGQVIDASPAGKTPQNPTASQSQAVTDAATTQRATPSAASSAGDSERSALTYTDFDFDVRLRPAENRLAVRALVTVRNDSKVSLAHIPLQLSSTLNWEQIRANNQPLLFTVATLNSDADHTGQLNEAIITPLSPLAPGASLQIDVSYSGTVTLSAKRLLAIGTPQDIAEHSDWDRISADFTGLRGFGNVVWYPVSSIPVVLGDGARLFDEIGNHKLRLNGSHFRLAVTVEMPPGQAPNIALINGHPVPLAVTPGPDATVATVATAKVEDTTLGFEAPSIFIANRTNQAVTNATIWTRPGSEANIPAWKIAAADVSPFLEGWLGKSPRSQLTILDLPEEGDIPFETAAMLATPIRAAAPDLLEGVMAHALTHAWIMSPRPWLSEGVAHFMGTLWIEKKQGRDRALATLDSGRSALALAEPESPGIRDGQPLISCISPVYYRTKAAYVFWMLRDLAGDPALSAAFRAYEPAKDTDPRFF